MPKAKKRKKILIVHATGGMGHVMAAKALEQAFAEYPNVEVKNIDVIEYAPSMYRKVFVGGYNFVSAKAPKVWNFLYHIFNRRSQQKLPQILSNIAIESKFIPFIQGYNPDFIISTHPLPMRIVSHSKQRDVIDIPSSIVVTDFGCHTFWIDHEANFYFVAADEVKDCFLRYHVSPRKLVVTGIPIRQIFSQPVDKQAILHALGFSADKPKVLIVGGQFTFDQLDTIIQDTKKRLPKMQFIIVAGRDQELYSHLKESTSFGSDPSVQIFSFIDNIHEYMAVADLIFSKAGGLTTSECLAMGLPMLIHKVIPGQEEDNVDYLLKYGAAVRVEKFDEIVKELVNLFSNPKNIENMKTAARAVGRPHSAKDLADFVMKQIK